MVITCIYNGLLACRLDNKQQHLYVEYVASRDFRMEDSDKVFEKLKNWYQHVSRVEESIEKSLNTVKLTIEDSVKRRKAVAEKAESVQAQAVADIESQKEAQRAFAGGPGGSVGSAFGMRQGFQYLSLIHI
eukprot:TRINITY_DN36_c0_g1_i4.p5 TRINITY_DN36_c0_g1~~TRINITY_DN36_c0_g1_i4.p5  ORF type:complete len:131 (-),score=15.58 TRINITY_DN36_c0_g1_i4:168-560(-)